MKTLALLLALMAPTLLFACRAPKTIHLPGETRSIDIELVFTDLPPALVSSIGSFSLMVKQGATEDILFLSYDAGSLTWLDGAPEGLPAHGTISFRLQGYDLAGAPLPLAGRSGTLDLDALPDGGRISVPILISTTNAFSPSRIRLRQARSMHTATFLPAGGILIAGGETGDPMGAASPSLAAEPEWLSLAASLPCQGTPSAVAQGCAWGEVPPPRIGHIAIALERFGTTCSRRMGALVGLGADAQGNGLDDLYLFDPAGFDGSGAFRRLFSGLRARVHAVAYATHDCRVVIVGGAPTAQGGANASATIIDLASPTPTVTTLDSLLPAPRAGATSLHLENTLDEIILVGGEDDAGNGLATAVSLVNGSGALEACALDDAECNGGTSTLACERRHPGAARFASEEPLSPALVLGGLGACSAELFLSTNNDVANRFVPITSTVPIVWERGFSTTTESARTVVIVGGLSQGTILDQAYRFTLETAVDENTSSAAGVFSALTALPHPLTGHRAYARSGTTIVLGGWDGAGARDEILVLVSTP